MTTTTHTSATTDILGLYRLCLEAPSSIINGAPVMRLSLAVDAVRRTITGQGEITPEELVVTDPEPAPVRLIGITGTVHATPDGPVGASMVLTLNGTALVDPSPLQPLTISYPFTATFATDGQYAGRGGWSYGTTHVENATIRSVSCDL